METLLIQETNDTPKVHFDKTKKIFEMSGLSVPENAIAFCEPVKKWIEEYSDNPNPVTDFIFKLEYFNTAFSTQIIQILLLLEKLTSKSKVKIYWYYRDIDEDMLELGQKYADIVNITFELHKYS